MLFINSELETEHFTEFPPHHKLKAFRAKYPGMSQNRIAACAALIELRNMGALPPQQCQQLITLIVNDAADHQQFSPPDLQRLSGLEQGHKPIYPKLKQSLIQTYSAIAGRQVEPEELF